jgi:hypothetical protein
MKTVKQEKTYTLANVLDCTAQDITAAKKIVGNSELKIQQYIKILKTHDNGHFLKVYVKMP